MNLHTHLTDIRSLLTLEEQEGMVYGMTDIARHQETRSVIRTQLSQLLSEFSREAARLERLPALPDVACIRWAQSVLAYPNGRLLVVDTMFPAKDAVLVQVLVLDFAGRVHLRRCVATGSPLANQDLHLLGVSDKDVQEAVRLPEIWPVLLEELTGRYIVSYDLPHVRTALDNAAEEANLEPLVIIGECLFQQCQRFYHASGLVGLASLCELIGHPLKAAPTITERACGQLRLLQAMAEGILGAR